MQLVLLKVLPDHAIRLAMVPPCSSQKLMKLVKMPNSTNSIHFGTNWVALQGTFVKNGAFGAHARAFPIRIISQAFFMTVNYWMLESIYLLRRGYAISDFRIFRFILPSHVTAQAFTLPGLVPSMSLPTAAGLRFRR
jgi:hypothetical protein